VRKKSGNVENRNGIVKERRIEVWKTEMEL
jgi:hypothetical protein